MVHVNFHHEQCHEFLRGLSPGPFRANKQTLNECHVYNLEKSRNAQHYDLVLATVLGGCLGLWGGYPTSGLGCLGFPAWCSEAATSRL